ncbi:hypothetical protein VTN00DRAFT_4654 [Thermoascus crustaceus]|uniref:uncharacterized protein n=1 Tax=Thermoascus crustaceus TaxID=5088 RepID=UPI0037439CF1
MRQVIELSVAPPYKSSDDAPHNDFQLLRHYIGRLGHHIRAAQKLVGCAPKLIGLLDEFDVRSIPTPPRAATPPTDGKTRLDSIIVRRFEEPASHGKIYLRWRPPDLQLQNSETSQKEQRDILNAMIRHIREEVLEQIRQRQNARAWHPDSVTGITESVRLEQITATPGYSKRDLEITENLDSPLSPCTSSAYSAEGESTMRRNSSTGSVSSQLTSHLPASDSDDAGVESDSFQAETITLADLTDELQAFGLSEPEPEYLLFDPTGDKACGFERNSVTYLATSWVKSKDARYGRVNSTVDIFAMDNNQQVASMLNTHLRLWGSHEDPDNLVAWTSSLLFALQYIFYRHADSRDKSCLDEIDLCVVDTASFPEGVFFQDMHLIRVYRSFDTSLQRLEGLRRKKHRDFTIYFYFGEYLSQGALKIEDKC